MDKGGAMIASGCAKVLLLMMVAIAGAPMMASCSQLNMYQGKWCTDSIIQVAWNSQCTEVPSDADSYKFYYNSDWSAYLYSSSGCSGDLISTLSQDVDCVQGVDFKSVFITDSSLFSLRTG